MSGVIEKVSEEIEEYKVEVESPSCQVCGHGKTWIVIDSAGLAGSESFDNEEDAQHNCEMLNEAYNRGIAFQKSRQ